MSKTTNLDLELTGTSSEDTSQSFLTWRQKINGESSDSNMNKIDAAVGDLKSTTSIIVDPKNNLIWKKGAWSGGVFYDSSIAFLKRRGTEPFEVANDVLIKMAEPTNYLYAITYFNNDDSFKSETQWLTIETNIPAHSKIAISIRYADETNVPTDDPLKNEPFDSLIIYNGISHGSMVNLTQKITEKTSNLLQIITPQKGSQFSVLLDLGEDVTFDDGVVFSFMAKDVLPEYTSNAIVDLKKDDGTHQYCTFSNFIDKYCNQWPSTGAANGRYYTDPSKYGAGVTFRYVEVRYTTAVAGTIEDCVLIAGDDRTFDYIDNISAVDYKMRNANGQKSFHYSGEKIDLRKNGFNAGELFYSMPMPTGADTIQDFAIYNDVLFQLYNPDIVRLIDLKNGTEIATYSIKCDHANSCSFSADFYSQNDEFPLLYISKSVIQDNTSEKIYVNRVTRSGSELIKTYYINSLENTGYFPYMSLDKEKNIIYLIGHTVPGFQTYEGEMIVSAWDCNNCTEADGEFIPAFIDKFTLPAITTIQGQSLFRNKIYAISSKTSDPHDTKIYVIDTTLKKITSIIDELPTYMINHECEGIDFLLDAETFNYNMVVSTPNIYFKLVF